MDIHKLGLLGTANAAKQLKVSQHRFWHIIKKYEVPHKKIGTGHVFLQQDIDILIKKREKNVKKYRKN